MTYKEQIQHPSKDLAFPFYGNNYKNFIKDMVKDNWKTPNTYAEYFKPLLAVEGVYVMINVNLWDNSIKTVYIGRSKNLKERHVSHPVKRILIALNNPDLALQVWFLECQNSTELEKELISKIKPILNKHFNNG